MSHRLNKQDDDFDEDSLVCRREFVMPGGRIVRAPTTAYTAYQQEPDATLRASTYLSSNISMHDCSASLTSTVQNPGTPVNLKKHANLSDESFQHENFKLLKTAFNRINGTNSRSTVQISDTPADVAQPYSSSGAINRISSTNSGSTVKHPGTPTKPPPMYTILHRPDTDHPSASSDNSEAVTDGKTAGPYGYSKWPHERAPVGSPEPTSKKKTGKAPSRGKVPRDDPWANKPFVSGFDQSPIGIAISAKYPNSAMPRAYDSLNASPLQSNPVQPDPLTVYKSPYADALQSNQAHAATHQVKDSSTGTSGNDNFSARLASHTFGRDANGRKATVHGQHTQKIAALISEKAKARHGQHTQRIAAQVLDNLKPRQVRNAVDSNDGGGNLNTMTANTSKLAPTFKTSTTAVPQVIFEEIESGRVEASAEQTENNSTNIGKCTTGKSTSDQDRFPSPGNDILSHVPRAMLDVPQHHVATPTQKIARKPVSEIANNSSTDDGRSPVKTPSESLAGHNAENSSETASPSSKPTDSRGRQYSFAILSNNPAKACVGVMYHLDAGKMHPRSPYAAAFVADGESARDRSALELSQQQKKGDQSQGTKNTTKPKKHHRNADWHSSSADHESKTSPALKRAPGDLWPVGVDGWHLPRLRRMSEKAAQLTEGTLVEPQGENEEEAWQALQKTKADLALIYSEQQDQTDDTTTTASAHSRREKLLWAKACMLNVRWYYVNLVAFRNPGCVDHIEELSAHHEAVQSALDADHAKYDIFSAQEGTAEHAARFKTHALMEAVFTRNIKVWRNMRNQRENIESGKKPWSKEKIADFEGKLADMNKQIEALQQPEAIVEASSMQATTMHRAQQGLGEKEGVEDEAGGKAREQGTAKEAGELLTLDTQSAEKSQLRRRGLLSSVGSDFGSVDSPVGESDGGIGLEGGVAGETPNLAETKGQKLGESSTIDSDSHYHSPEPLPHTAEEEEMSSEDEVLIFAGRGKKPNPRTR